MILSLLIKHRISNSDLKGISGILDYIRYWNPFFDMFKLVTVDGNAPRT